MTSNILSPHRSESPDLPSAAGHTTSAVCTVNRQGRVTLVNVGAQRLLGWGEEDLMGTRLHDRLHACHPDEVCDLRVASWADTERFGGEYLFHRGDTELRTPEDECVRVSYMTAPLIVDGRVEGAVLVFHPVPARTGVGRGDDTSPRASLAHVTALVLANAPGPDEALGELLPAICEAGNWDIGTYWALDLRRQSLRWHAGWHRPGIEMARFDSMCRQLSFERGTDFPGRAWQEGKTLWVHDLRTEGDVLRSLGAMRDGLRSGICIPVSAGGQLRGVIELLSRRARQADEATMEAAAAAGVQIGRYLERLGEEEDLRYRAQHDVLTGLPNRELFQHRLTTALEGARDGGTYASVLLVDLDDFKQVNDSYGHHAGDALLRRVARRLESALRRTDIVARMGGDEFAVLLPDATIGEGLRVAEKVLAAVREPAMVEGRRVTPGASIGVATYPTHAPDPYFLLRVADEAMYQAKRTHTGIAVWGDEAPANHLHQGSALIHGE